MDFSDCRVGKEKEYKPVGRNLRRLIVIAAILAAFALIRFSGLGHHLNFQALKQNADVLHNYMEANYWNSVALFILAYFIVAAFSIPGALILSLAGGFLFGTIQGAVYSNIGATIGAGLAFLSSRYVIGGWIQRRYAERLNSFNCQIDRNGYRYLLTLRLIALFPFFVINILAGLTRTRLRTFLWTTSAGIFPADLLYSFAGSRLNYIERSRDIFSPQIILALVLLGALPVLHLAITKLKKNNSSCE